MTNGKFKGAGLTQEEKVRIIEDVLKSIEGRHVEECIKFWKTMNYKSPEEALQLNCRRWVKVNQEVAASATDNGISIFKPGKARQEDRSSFVSYKEIVNYVLNGLLPLDDILQLDLTDFTLKD